MEGRRPSRPYRGRGGFRGRGGRGAGGERGGGLGGGGDDDLEGARRAPGAVWRGRRGNGRCGRGGARPHLRTMHPIGYNALKDKLTVDPGDLLVELCSDRSPMRPHLVDPQLHVSKPDFVNLLLGVLARAIECRSSPYHRNQLFGFLTDSEFFKTAVPGKLLDKQFGFGDAAWPALANYLAVAEGMVTTVGGAWRIVHPVLLELLEQTREWNENGWTMLADGQTLLQRVIDGIKAARERQQREKVRGAERVRGVDAGPPPEDFRELSIFPTSEDLKVKKPYLRVNKVDGAYDDCEHYLDVQFRLLREDFMSPLRAGVAKYQEQAKLKQTIGRLQDIKLYYGIVILGGVVSHHGLTYRIRFDTSKMRNIQRLMASKQLLHGSLLCLSADNFETVFIATVQDKNTKDIVRGELEVIFEGPSAALIQAIDYSTLEFTMVETTAYFEAYRHILEGLKDLKPTELPFQRYIVRCSCTGDNPPAYLRQLMFTYDLTCIAPMEQQHSATARLRQVLAQPGALWPKEADLGLDASQLAALRLALCNEFAVIQGPPGTGKTYIGLKIVRVLLENLSKRNGLPSTMARRDPFSNAPLATAAPPRLSSPILVVCHTNHALDQFLEGIYDYAEGGIVRVGSRSKSEKLEQCNIKKLRDHAQISLPVRRRYAEVRSEINARRWKTMILAKRMALPDKGILQFHVIETFIQENHAWQLRPPAAFDCVVKSDDLLKAWLGLAPMPDIMSGVEDSAGLLLDDGNPDLINDEAVRPDAQKGGAEQNDEEESSDDEFIDAEENVFETRQRKLEDSDDEDLGTAVMELQLVEAEEIAVNLETLAAKQRAARASGADHPAAFAAAAATNAGHGWTTVTRKTSPRQLLKKLRTTKPMVAEQEQAVGDIWRLKADVRWRLYMTWVCRYRKSLSDKLVEESQGHDERVRELNALRMQGDIALLRKARVVGMTTAGAAKYRHVLQEVRPLVIIVEEAAEVLEAHIVTTLSPSCKHLILIGDHKQLRPNPTVYELAKIYKLDMSLFERMVQNNLPYCTLSTQHRMRPEISYVMRHIYDNLVDHESVLQYENVQGVKHNMFYVSHTEHEEHDDVISSHSNSFEAKFVVALCRYLMQQGYRAGQITVLTPYTGQLLLLRSLMRHKSDNSFEDVRVTSIDNYQGEENDIVLLSTVRSNNEGRVGFTNVSNRVCVALSRAKKGLYVLGNFSMLEMHSELWRKIISDLAKSGKLGPKLPLICQSHGNETLVGCAEDFSKAIDGGCSLLCEARMACGHSCDLMCHPFESAHDADKCRKPCRKRFADCGHPCTRTCAADCGNCRTPVMRVLACGHHQKLPCHVDPANHRCLVPCERRLRCGHLCGRKCGDACDSKCLQAVSRVYSCGHTNKVLCHQLEDEAPCKEPCVAVLACMHPCTGTCGSCHQGRLHKPCSEECKRPLVCGHLCEGRCCNGCPPCRKPCENRCPHSKCTKACGEPCTPCKELCGWKCEHYKCTRLCSEPCDRPPCDQRCPLSRTCKTCNTVAPCIGLCGEPCPLVCDHCDPTRPYRQVLFGDEGEPDARFLQLEDCKHIIVSTAMDRWMRLMPDDGSAAASNDVGLKGCPRCKTPIRRCVRYGILVNAQLDDIEKVKVKMRGFNADLEARLNLVEAQAAESGFRYELSVSAAMRTISRSNNIRILEFQMDCLEKIKKLSGQCQADTVMNKDLTMVKKFLLPLHDSLRQQEFNDVISELMRLEYATLLAGIQRNLSSSSIAYPPTSNQAILRASQLLTGRFDDHKQKEMKLLEPMLPKLSGFVSLEEKHMIIRAMDFAKTGHWYKCPNGHIYCITECGGATEESMCPDCKCIIGGSSHHLRADNQVATEMDGATQPAFSEANNFLPHQYLG